MVKIAFILLCHKDAPAIIRQAERLTATGDCVAIHFDARGDGAEFAAITKALADTAGVVIVRRRVRCGWGEWSLVQATLNALEAAGQAFPDATHFYMLSGDCMSIKSAAHAHAMLAPADRDYIESFDFFTSYWIKTGFRRERLVYRHPFNERKAKRLFYAFLEVQKRLGLERRLPEDLQIMIGSQWWCLRRDTVQAVLRFCRARPDVIRFFRLTWIPDETFFQTLVRHLVPWEQIESRSLTFKMFSDYGMPVNFYNDQYDLLISQDYLFARKISPGAQDLKARLGELWASGRQGFPISDNGPQLYRYLAGRGRIGRRFGPRFWEREAKMGEDRELLMILCKKWHVAKRLLHAVQTQIGINGVEYLFDEESCFVPNLGGVEKTLEKRNRHRRAVMRLLFDYHGADRMLICIDPSNLDLMQDFTSDQLRVKLLEVSCTLDDPYLLGHARRVGLVSDQTPPEIVARVLPALRHEFDHEVARIREAGFPDHLRLRQDQSVSLNAAVLGEFLSIPDHKARLLADLPDLFDD